MFGINRKAINDNKLAEMQMDKERLERTIMGLRRNLDHALCPLSGLKQQGYAAGMAEGIQRGRKQAELAGHRPHQHDFAALEARIMACMASGTLSDDWVYRGYSRSQWRSGYASLQNLPRRNPPKLIGLSLEHNGKPYQWAVGDNDVIELRTSPGYKDPSKLKVTVTFKDGSFSTTTFKKNLFTQAVTYLWEGQ